MDKFNLFPRRVKASFSTQKLLSYLFLFGLLICSACKKDDDASGDVIDPPILLCEVYGLGNMDENNMKGTTFTFENNPNAPVDYVIDCFPRVLVDVTIAPGTVIEFGEDAGLLVLMDGSLSAVGSAVEPIIMRGTSTAKGWWRGIAYGVTDIRNELNHVTIDGAGGLNTIQGGSNVALFDNSNGLKIQNTTISNSGDYGFIKSGLEDLGAFSNNIFTNNEGFPVYIHAEKLSQLDGTGSTYTNNGSNMIQMAITSGSVITVVTNQSWKNPGIPLLMDEGTLGINADLTIEPGFELVMRPDCAITIDDLASLKAIGTAAQPIIFRGEQDVQGYWEFMYIEGSSTLNQFDHVTISNAGRIKPFGAAPSAANLYIGNGTENLNITNTTISKSLSCGMYQGTNVAINMSDNIFSDNADGDICP